MFIRSDHQPNQSTSIQTADLSSRALARSGEMRSGRSAYDPEAACTAAGLQCASDCITLMTCVRNGQKPVSARQCASPTPYCVKGTCTSEPDSSNTECTTSSSGSIYCPSIGLFPDPNQCDRYHNCDAADTDSQVLLCDSGFVYYSLAGLCRRRDNDGMCQRLNKCRNPQDAGKLVRFDADPAFFAVCSTVLQSQETAAATMLACADPTVEIFDEQQQQCRYDCKQEGSVVDRSNCRGYIECRRLNGRWAPARMQCQPSASYQFLNGRCVRNATQCVSEDGTKSPADATE